MSSPPRHGLFNVPPDIINELSYYLSGKDALYLWLTGCQRLRYTMCELRGLRRLHLQTSGSKHLRMWPVIISSFKNLEELSLNFGSPVVVEGSIKQAFESWPKTIRRLKLCFREAETCWSKISCLECFPNIEELDLDGWSGFKAVSFDNMPASLTSLILRGNNSAAIASVFKRLPSDFQRIELSFNNKVELEALKALPQNLKSLSLPGSNLKLEWIPYIPRSVTHLAIALYDSSQLAQVVPLLPPGLVYFKFYVGFNWNQVTVMDAALLPATLQTLAMAMAPYSFAIKDLPRGLTSLSIAEPLQHANEFSCLPSLLRRLELHGASLTDDFTTYLPRSLTSLILHRARTSEKPIAFSLTDKCIPNLPRNLLELIIELSDELTSECFAELPRFLHTLELTRLTQASDEHFKDLPKFLHKLYLQSATGLTDECAADLPRNIAALRILNSPLFTCGCIDDLPAFINDLDLGPNGINDKYTTDRNRRSKIDPPKKPLYYIP